MSVGSFPTAGKGTGWLYALNLKRSRSPTGTSTARLADTLIVTFTLQLEYYLMASAKPLEKV